ncbi:terminase family protein [Novosphingobium sp. ZN18A2]|uniref:DNA-packaging protein n=1 Tax=Novosphingobium sp. ZN18A2 TaxID=3079861 RepID=UPI0030D4D692
MTSESRREWLENLPVADLRRALWNMSPRQRRSIRHHWHLWAHEGQLPPPGAWHCWLIMAGRGFGKTRAGAEWVRAVAERDPAARIALVGASLGEVRSVQVEGESGILAVSPWRRRPKFEPSRRLLVWPNGAEARLYSAGEPESLRGPQHSHAWCDEIAKWDNSGGRAGSAWDNMQFGLRLGAWPRVMATTTPRAVPLLRRILDDRHAVVTRGATGANSRNLPPAFMRAVRRQFAGTKLGRQELDGELIEDIEGALWSRALIERTRENGSPPLTRVVIGVDPPASADGDACGIVAVGLGEDRVAHVLADLSVERPSPETWARAVADGAAQWQADRVVAEANQGGAMVESVLRAADAVLPLRLVHASRGKAARAEPVAALYEAGRVRHAGTFPALEDQLCGLMPGGEYRGPTRSPDRADAAVWALTELMLGRANVPRIRPA